MESRSTAAISKHVGTLLRFGTAVGLADGILLDRFCGGSADEAQAAFAVLVQRHGPMVMHVCRRILGDRHEAEDAAQATFLVLARQAGSIRRKDSVTAWLHGIAVRIAGRARRGAARRRLRERRVAEVAMLAHRAVADDPEASEIASQLHEELDRLPERFRLPILLCHLEGLTYEQAANRLGCPVRTVQSRLSRARRRLRDRLVRRGVAPATISLAVALKPDVVSACVAEGWKNATVQAAVHGAVSGSAVGIASDAAVALAEGVSKAMMIHRLLNWGVCLVALGVVVGGTGMVMRGGAEPVRNEKLAPTPASPEDNRYRVTMANGATVEVVGVAKPYGRPQIWWKPDGSRFDEAPADPIVELPNVPSGKDVRIILVRATGLKKDDLFRWHPTSTASYWGRHPTKNGRKEPGLEAYLAFFDADQAECGIQAGVASGTWKTEISNDGHGGSNMGANGHRFAFGKARPLSKNGRSMTAFAVAHNFFEQDRRLVAIDRNNMPNPAVAYSSGFDGDPKWGVDLIDGEFDVPTNLIREYEVQFRPFEKIEIRGIALNPRP